MEQQRQETLLGEDALYVSMKTVESHRKNIMDKLEIRCVAELTKYAVREGLTSLDF